MLNRWLLSENLEMFCLGIALPETPKNVIHAARAAKALGLSVISLTGESGGKLAPIADHSIRAPATETPVFKSYICQSTMLYVK